MGFDISRYIDYFRYLSKDWYPFDNSRCIDTFWHFEIYRYFFDTSRKIRELSICKTRKAECNNRQNVFWWLKHYIQKRNGLSNLFTMTLAHFEKRKTQFPGKSFSPERNGLCFDLLLLFLETQIWHQMYTLQKTIFTKTERVVIFVFWVIILCAVSESQTHSVANSTVRTSVRWTIKLFFNNLCRFFSHIIDFNS